jgi:hypothetical protein
MDRNGRWTLALLAMAVLAGGTLPARAQISSAIVVHSSSSKSSSPKPDKFLGDVIFSSSTAITVRSRTNERIIRTFSYGAQIRDKMEKILDRGGYQYGDKVEIYYQPGTDVALRIKGKPSKPL